jgi:hypothetical protein
MAMVWAVDEEAVLRVDNPIFESEFRENGLFNLGAEHTARTAPAHWTQSCQPCPEPSVESEDDWRAMDGAQRVVNPLCTRAVPEIEPQARNAKGQSSPLQMVAVPEPARVMVRATRQGQQSQQQSWLQFSATMYLMRRSQARARLAEKY